MSTTRAGQDPQQPPSNPRASNHSSTSSASTIIEVDHQSHSNSTNLDNQIDSTIEHEHRLRLIEANRIQNQAINHPDQEGCCSTDVGDKDLVQIEVLLTTSNQRKSFEFERSIRIQDIKELIFNQWPTEWNQNQSLKPNQSGQLKMVFLGRFLNDHESLSNLRLNQDSSTIIHLIIKPIEPDHNLESKEDKKSCWMCCFNR